MVSSEVVTFSFNDSKIAMSEISSLYVNDSTYLMQHKVLLQLNYILYYNKDSW